MASPPSPEDPAAEVQRTVVLDALRLTLPLLTVIYLIILCAALAVPSYRAEPRRLAPVGLGLACIGAGWLYRRSVAERAVWMLSLGMATTIAAGMMLNGGVRAPGTLGVFGLVAMITWTRGGRAAAAATAGLTLLCLTLAALAAMGAVPPPPVVPPLPYAIILVLMMWFVWLFNAKPHARLRDAITDAAARERELRAERDRREATQVALQAVFDQVAHLLVLVDARGGVVDANRAAQELLAGPAAGPLVGRAIADAPGWPEAERAALRAAIDAARDDGATTRFEVRLAASGRVLDLTVAPCRDAAGALRYVILEGRDVSALLELKEREHQAHRMDLVGQLAGGIAHDFNNVLGAIVGSADLVKEDLDLAGTLTPEAAEGLDAIAAASQRAASLTRQLLSFGRRATLERRPLALHGLIRSTVQLLARSLPPTIKVETTLGAADDGVVGDAASLESVLLNLCVNARDAMPRGGTLTLATRRVEVDAAACAASPLPLRPGPHLRVTVSDTGTGIDPAILARIFEPYFTTKPAGRGTGIGLASVFGAMRDHGGAIHVESTVGRGTAFHLDLPLATAAPAAPPPARTGGALAGLRCLVVDDEPPLLRMVARILTGAGAACATAPDAEQGLAVFEAAAAPFDVAILDVVLPGRQGSELAADLLARAPGLRVLLVSGFPRDAQLDALPRDRARLLHKPFSAEDLRTAVAGLLGASGASGAPGAATGDVPRAG